MINIVIVSEFLRNANPIDLKKRLPRLLHGLLRNRDHSLATDSDGNRANEASAVHSRESVDKLLKKIGDQPIRVRGQIKKFADLTVRAACRFAVRKKKSSVNKARSVSSTSDATASLLENEEKINQDHFLESDNYDSDAELSELTVASLNHLQILSLPAAAGNVLQVMFKLNKPKYVEMLRRYGQAGLESRVRRRLRDSQHTSTACAVSRKRELCNRACCDPQFQYQALKRHRSQLACDPDENDSASENVSSYIIDLESKSLAVRPSSSRLTFSDKKLNAAGKQKVGESCNQPEAGQDQEDGYALGCGRLVSLAVVSGHSERDSELKPQYASNEWSSVVVDDQFAASAAAPHANGERKWVNQSI